jgi:hypothetical protein
MYAPATNRPSPATRSPEGAHRSGADGWSHPRAGPLPPSAAATLAIPRHARRQGHHHPQCRSGTGIQRDPTQASPVAKR